MSANSAGRETSRGPYRLSCDIGGTFTDFCLIDRATGEIDVEKCLTTPGDPSQGVLDGVRMLAARHPDLLRHTESVLHATTLVINAIIERKGARTGLVTTRGFRDVLEIGREMRYDLYDIQLEFPKPLVPRHRRTEVTERVLENGAVRTPLDTQDVATAAATLAAEGVESVAVCFLHSYANPQHEQRTRTELERLMPGIPVSISSDVLPEIREFERTTTTVANAYVKPLASRYTARLVDGLRDLGFTRRLLIMLSSGGMTSVETAAEYPVRIVESGPAAGAIAAEHVGRVSGFPEHVLAFDMGGTTAKGCVIENGHIDMASTFESARVHRFRKGSGIPLRIPVIDIMEIGAGGGSIATRDGMGLLQVGPESAGALPGPACYGRGGTKPTVSDADLVLGYLDATHFLGGDMRLDEAAARDAIDRDVAKPLSLTTAKAAWAIHELVTENMAAAIQIHMAEKGVDPARFTLVAFGGAGPVHAYALAKRLGTRRILVPQGAGIASAFGLLVAPVSFDLVRTYRQTLDRLDANDVEALYGRMESEARGFVEKAGEAIDIAYVRSLDICYSGQGYAVNVELPQAATPLTKQIIRERFERVYERLYGRFYPDMEPEIMNARLVARSATPSMAQWKHDAAVETASAIRGTRRAWSGTDDDYIEHTVYDRYRLPSGATLAGPAIIEERESTTIIGAGGRVEVDANGTLVVTLPEVPS